MDDRIPETQPSGALTPPPGHPPTAIATSAPLPPRGPAPRPARYRTKGIRGLIESALDQLDSLAERIAHAAGLR